MELLTIICISIDKCCSLTLIFLYYALEAEENFQFCLCLFSHFNKYKSKPVTIH